MAKGCTIENNVSIDGNIIIGNNVSIGSGTRLIGDIVIGDNVDIDENVVLRGKMSESSKITLEAKEILSIDDNVSIGANSTISGVFNVGFAARVYPASAVSKEILKFASTSGNPAEIIGYRSSGYDPVLEEVHKSIQRMHVKFAEFLGLQICEVPWSMASLKKMSHLKQSAFS